MSIYWEGVSGMAVFYVVMVSVGFWASRKKKDNSQEEFLLAGRGIGFSLGLLTLIATWVGGSYINATSEALFTQGLAWCQVPFGYSLSLLVGALFISPMRKRQYMTMIDPIQERFGNKVGMLNILPAFMGDIFWIASILNSLGSALVVILGLTIVTSVLISAGFAAIYTMMGGLYGVTYTDPVQLVLIIVGMVLSAPFAATNTHVHYPLNGTSWGSEWIGHVESSDWGSWMDTMLLLVLGGVPWQGYFQRILSMKTTLAAQTLSVIAVFGCLIIGIPAAIIGIIGRYTDWENVEHFNRKLTPQDGEIILPLVLRYLTPQWVSFFGLGAITAAVMSSADSSLLASASLFSRNIYQNIFRPKASDRELVWVVRLSVLSLAIVSSVVALSVRSIYYLSLISGDLTYVITFPQLMLVVFWPEKVNNYGCLVSFFLALVLRILGGESNLGMPALIRFPDYDEKKELQRFPFRTFIMILTIIVHLAISQLASFLFKKNILSTERWDFLNGFPELHKPEKKDKPRVSEITIVGTIEDLKPPQEHFNTYL